MITTAQAPAPAKARKPDEAERVAELQKTISASRLSLWLQCTLKFYFKYILQLQKPPTPARHAGSTVHLVLKQWNIARCSNDVQQSADGGRLQVIGAAVHKKQMEPASACPEW